MAKRHSPATKKCGANQLNVSRDIPAAVSILSWIGCVISDEPTHDFAPLDSPTVSAEHGALGAFY